MKKVISIEDNFQDPAFIQRPRLTVVRDPEKLPVVLINKKDGLEESNPEKTKYAMPEMPAGYIKCKKHDCL